MMVVDVDLEEAECEWFSEKDQKTHRKSFMFEMLVNVNNIKPKIHHKFLNQKSLQ